MKQKIKDFSSSHKNFLLYVIIGCAGVILDFIAFLILYNLLGVNPVVATMISVLLGITINFALNAVFNFKKTNKLHIRYLSFLTVGLSGLLISTYILAFGEVFDFNANIVKIASLPIIVVYQYFLNKNISFRDIGKNTTLRSLTVSAVKKHWGLIAINVIFLICALSFVKSVPFLEAKFWMDTAPDEVGHFRYNTEFMLRYHRLPVSGKDDVEAYQSCKQRDYGKVPCTYSYVVFPGANYVFSAATSKIVTSTFDVAPIKGARISSVLWGLAFINFMYLLAVRLTSNRRIAWSIAALALIPQVIFTFSYLNQDAHSLAISAICVYALIRLLQDKSTSSIILAAISFGALLPLAKYNYFLLIPVIGIVLVAASLFKKLSWSVFLKVTIGAFVAFMAFSSFWFIRNAILYQDPLGQSFVIDEMSKYAPLGSEIALNLKNLEMYTNMNFFDILYRSFFLTFGSMAHFMPVDRYGILQLLLLGLVAVYAYIAYHTQPAKVRLYLFILLISFATLLAAAIGLVLYNSLVYDFQPQGRYLYLILAPLAALIGLAYRLQPRMKYVLWGMLFIIGYVLFNAIDVYMRNYLA